MSRCKIIGTWLLMSCLLGIIASRIPWGDPKAFHGRGIPVFTVAFERSRTTGEFIPYSSPLGYALNPFAVFIIGIGVWFAAKAIRRLFQARRRIE